MADERMYRALVRLREALAREDESIARLDRSLSRVESWLGIEAEPTPAELGREWRRYLSELPGGTADARDS